MQLGERDHLPLSFYPHPTCVRAHHHVVMRDLNSGFAHLTGEGEQDGSGPTPNKFSLLNRSIEPTTCPFASPPTENPNVFRLARTEITDCTYYVPQNEDGMLVN